MLRSLLEGVARAIGGFSRSFRARSTEILAFELRERENVFGLLTLGAFAGMSAPPAGISLRLAPHMAREVHVMVRRVGTLDDAAGELFGLVDIG